MLSLAEIRLLLEFARQPWSSSAQIALAAGISREEAASYCERLMRHELLQCATQSLSHLPRSIYAPTTAGIRTCLQDTGLTMRRLGLTPERFWAMRTGLEVTMEVNAIFAKTALSAAPTRVVWETYIPRRNRKRPLYLHGRIAIFSESGARAFYLLNDRGEGPVTVWYHHLRYYTLWARRKPIGFPSVLIFTTRPFRAWALLTLARMGAGKSAIDLVGIKDSEFAPPSFDGKVSFIATVERVTAIREGLQAVAGSGKGWKMLMPNNTLVGIDPFTQPPIPIDVFKQGVHACRCMEPVSSIRPDALEPDTFGEVLPTGGARKSRQALATEHLTNSMGTPSQFEAMQHLESLGDSEYRALAFLCRHPVCPASTVAAFTGLQEGELSKVLVTLQSADLIEPATISQAQIKTRRQLPTLWLVSEDAVCLRALRSGLDPDFALRRYRFFASDHTRRPYHTLATHHFFERLKRYCLQRSHATRYLDAVPDEPNEGQVNYYDLAVYDAELIASDHYCDAGQMRLWRPDGYGALRGGADWTRFWLEVDGSSDIPSRAGPDTWYGKLGGLCDYYCSMRWRLRYPSFPQLLIVTTNQKNLPMAHDALITSARGRSISVPKVYMAPEGDVSKYGAMARVWHNVATENDERCYAFDNAIPLNIV